VEVEVKEMVVFNGEEVRKKEEKRKWKKGSYRGGRE